MPKVDACGQVRREIGETVVLDSTPYAVIQVTPSGALCKQSGPKVVQSTDDEGNEVTVSTRGKATIRIGAYREPCDDYQG